MQFKLFWGIDKAIEGMPTDNPSILGNHEIYTKQDLRKFGTRG